jgi:hypothetical protein
MEVTDLADGEKLLKLLEILTGEKLGKLNRGNMRIHKLKNVNESLTFLQTKEGCLTAYFLACFESLTAALLKVQVSWDVTLCDAKHLKGALLDQEFEGTAILGNVSIYTPSDTESHTRRLECRRNVASSAWIRMDVCCLV